MKTISTSLQSDPGTYQFYGLFRVALNQITKTRFRARLVSSHSYPDKANFHVKSFAPGFALAFVMRLQASEVAIFFC